MVSGGGTIDISAYAQTSPLGNSYEEIAASRCGSYAFDITDAASLTTCRLCKRVCFCHGQRRKLP